MTRCGHNSDDHNNGAQGTGTPPLVLQLGFRGKHYATALGHYTFVSLLHHWGKEYSTCLALPFFALLGNEVFNTRRMVSDESGGKPREPLKKTGLANQNKSIFC